MLNYAKGYRERSLDFLENWPITRIRILARTITDLTPVYRMASTLESLSVITAPKATLDLARLPRLTHLEVSWEQVESSIEAAVHLRELYPTSYNPRDLTPLSQNQQLRILSMKDRPYIESLAGIDAFPMLEILGIYSARGLSDLSDLASASGHGIYESYNSNRIAALPDSMRSVQLPILSFSTSANLARSSP